MPKIPYETIAQRIARYSEEKDGHILWTGGLTHGYGTVGYEGKTYRVHRVAWELKNGPIPEGMVVMHKCDVKNCLNPEHLELGTMKDNTEDMIKKGRHARKGPQVGQTWCNLKLTEEQVRYILTSDKTTYALWKELGVSRTTISQIRQRKLWKHVVIP